MVLIIKVLVVKVLVVKVLVIMVTLRCFLMQVVALSSFNQ